MFSSMNSRRKTAPVADYGGGFAFAENNDVLTEILLRLPTKCVVRFQLVCKNWLAIISADQFRHLHTLRLHKPQPSLILRTRISEFLYFNPNSNGEHAMTVPLNFTLPNPKILSSCNGLLLLRCDNPQSDDDFYYVYNPTTKQSRQIILNYEDDFPRIIGLHLAFDPSKSPHYKIVCVRGSRPFERTDRPFALGLRRLPFQQNRSYQIEVYDSVSRTWKLCLEPFTDTTELNFSSGVHWNNSIYWNTEGDEYFDGRIMSFDIDRNVIGSLPLPRIRRSRSQRRKIEYGFPRLQESNGHLYYFVISSKGESVAVWELQRDDPSQWFLKYHHHPPTGIFDKWCSNGLLRFIRGLDGEETASALVTYVPGKIKAYRFLDKSFQELADLSNQPFYHENSLQFDFQDVHQFGESLALV